MLESGLGQRLPSVRALGASLLSSQPGHEHVTATATAPRDLQVHNTSQQVAIDVLGMKYGIWTELSFPL